MQNRDLDNIARLERSIAPVERCATLFEQVTRNVNLEPTLRQVAELHTGQLRQLATLPEVDGQRLLQRMLEPVMDQRLIQTMLEPVHQTMQRNLRLLVPALQQSIDVRKMIPRDALIPKLPDLTRLAGLRDSIREAVEALTAQGDAVLKISGFGFADDLWDWDFIASFAEVGHVDPKVRNAVVTNKLAAETRTEWFEDWLEEEIVGSSVLRPRWEIIRQALGAHKRREYLISIPTLLAQIEGAIGDALVLRNLAVKDGHKLYLLGADGRPALDSKNKPIELKGLTGLVNNLDLFDYEALDEARSFITDYLIPSRHAILHGRNTSYGKARLSVQALLILLILAAEVRAFEESNLRGVPSP